MDHGNTAIAVVAWLLWCIHLMAYRRAPDWPAYIRYVWQAGLFTLPLLGGITLARPTGLLSAYMVLVCVAMIGMWVGAGVVVWCHVLRERGSRVLPEHASTRV